MSKKLYDIQGVPIRVGSLVAVPTNGGLMKGRVTKLYSASIDTSCGQFVSAWDCVVLEEPVWPNS